MSLATGVLQYPPILGRTFDLWHCSLLEQNKVDIPTIRAVRVSAMGPLGGIGDALFWFLTAHEKKREETR